MVSHIIHPINDVCFEMQKFLSGKLELKYERREKCKD